MHARARRFAEAISALVGVWPAPAARLGELAAEAEALAAALAGEAEGASRGEGELAAAIAAALRYLQAGVIEAPEVALTLAASADALARALDAGLGAVALAAARYELETFFPAVGARPPEEPDVPLSSLSRRDR